MTVSDFTITRPRPHSKELRVHTRTWTGVKGFKRHFTLCEKSLQTVLAADLRPDSTKNPTLKLTESGICCPVGMDSVLNGSPNNPVALVHGRAVCVTALQTAYDALRRSERPSPAVGQAWEDAEGGVRIIYEVKNGIVHYCHARGGCERAAARDFMATFAVSKVGGA